MRFFLKTPHLILFIICLIVLAPVSKADTEINKRPITLQDIMKFKAIENTLISEDGNWVVYQIKPDRGNGQVIVYNTVSRTNATIERAEKPIISKDGRWVAAALLEDALKSAKNKKDDIAKKGMALMETSSQNIISFEKIKNTNYIQ